jgi:hypothetical protein
VACISEAARVALEQLFVDRRFAAADFRSGAVVVAAHALDGQRDDVAASVLSGGGTARRPAEVVPRRAALQLVLPAAVLALHFGNELQRAVRACRFGRSSPWAAEHERR